MLYILIKMIMGNHCNTNIITFSGANGAVE